MYDFFTHAVVLLWAIIGALVGAILLVFIFGFIAHEIFVLLVNLVNRNPDNEENLP